MNLDDTLRDTLADDRWALPVRPDTLDRVRRGRAARRRRTALVSATAALTLAGAGAVVLTNLPQGSGTRLGTYASGGTPAGSPVPGISPPFLPDSGRDWLLTSAQWSTYSLSHTGPSPGPGQSTVASPAPLAEQSAGLLAEVQAAGLPAGAVLRREDSVGGQPGSAAVHVMLADGTPLEVLRSTLPEPIDVESFSGDGEGQNQDATVVDITGTSSAAAVFPTLGYGFADETGSGAHGVIVVTRGGVATTWAAPSRVPLGDLQRWAIAAAQHAG